MSTKHISTQRNVIKNQPGFFLWAEKDDVQVGNTVFISGTDFDLVLDKFEAEFPLANPLYQTVETHFDHCAHNYFDRQTCQRIVDNLAQIKSESQMNDDFIQELVLWLKEQLKCADNIVIEGNL